MKKKCLDAKADQALADEIAKSKSMLRKFIIYHCFFFCNQQTLPSNAEYSKKEMISIWKADY